MCQHSHSLCLVAVAMILCCILLISSLFWHCYVLLNLILWLRMCTCVVVALSRSLVVPYHARLVGESTATYTDTALT